MIHSLDKKWKELLFAFSGFGPNFLMILMGSYYSDALNPSALESGEQFQAIMPGVCFILPALFPILYALGKIFDGIIDIPFAHITDSLSTKWGRRRPAIAVCFIPMVISYLCCWIPIGGESAKLLNTIWVSIFTVIFFASYTMCLISFYGSFSAVCETEQQRLRISGYKSFFDTVTYCLVYALVPVILSGMKIQIDTLVFLSLPLMLTMTIPLFMIKEGEKYGYPENARTEAKKLSIKESIGLTFRNRLFRKWLAVNACTFFGLQMFLSAMNGMIIGGMGLNGIEMAIFNTCAFAPVPVMLYLFNKVKAKYGTRPAYQSCLLIFAVSILSFFFGSRFILGEGNLTLKMIIGITGGLLASWSIGIFFMMPYLVPAQISSSEERLTGKNHSAMYFAGDALATSIVGAVSGSLIYEYIKNLFISKKFSGIVWATSSADAYRGFAGITDASYTVSAEESATVFNLGNLLVPFIVCITCILGFFLAYRLPRNITPAVVAEELKKTNPDLAINKDAVREEKFEKTEILFVQIGLFVLSGTLFGFIWCAFLMNSVKELCKKLRTLPYYIVSAFIPFASIFTVLKMRGIILESAMQNGLDIKISKPLLIAFCIIFPILPVNPVSLAILQHKMNKLIEAKEA